MRRAGRHLGVSMALLVIGSCAQGVPGSTAGASFGPATTNNNNNNSTTTNDSDFTTGGRPDSTDGITTRPVDPSTGSTTGRVDTSSGAGPECGDGVADPGEECDRDDLLGLGCADVDPVFTGGTLACTTRCTFDTSGCGSAPNPIVECSSPDTPIPDANPVGVTDTIVLRPEMLGGVITDVNVEVELDHTFIGDLTIDVTHAGTPVLLHDSCTSSINLHAIYDDQAGTAFDCDQSDLGLPVRPQGTLDDLDGTAIETEWTLFVVDQVGADFGTLNRWCVTISWM